MAAFARTERRALCQTFRAVGPDAPTLCEGWLTRDLAAHLVLRETRPVAALGIVVSAMGARTLRVQRSLARLPWPQLVDRVEHPPFWTPLSWGPLEDAANLHEHFVHHEDVLRARPGWAEPRPLDPAYEKALWSTASSHGRLLFRRSPVGVVLHGPDGATATVRRPQSAGSGSVTVTGRPGELLLYAFGRTDHARVDLDGAPKDRTAFRAVHLGL